jgi:Mini-chromosome maintenance replisome factor
VKDSIPLLSENLWLRWTSLLPDEDDSGAVVKSGGRRRCFQNIAESGPRRRLVRLTGFVQDMLDTEYFHCGQDRHGNGQESNLQLLERTPLVLVPIPGATPWFEDLCLSTPDAENGHENSCKKMKLDPEKDLHKEISSMQSRPPANSKIHLYYDVYSVDDSNECHNKLRLNDVVEVIAMIDMDDYFDQSDCPMSLFDEFSPNVLDSHVKIPSLHVVWFQHKSADTMLLSSLETNSPHVNISREDEQADVSFAERDPPTILTAQDQIEKLPGNALGHVLGLPDSESMLSTAIWLTLLSRAERKRVPRDESTGSLNQWYPPVITPDGSSLGCASLSIMLPDAESCHRLGQSLSRVLGMIVPVVRVVTVTNESLSEPSAWIPKKVTVNGDGRLSATSLQLPEGSLVIIDISQVQPGLLSPTQIETLQSLQNLTQNHALPYFFDGNVRITFEADYRIIVLTAAGVGSKLLPCLIQMNSTHCTTSGQENSAHDEAWRAEIDAMRRLLVDLRVGSSDQHGGNIALSSAVLEYAQKDFVARRVAARDRVGAEPNDPLGEVNEHDFHRWLTLTRLFARSRRSHVAMPRDWQDALALDDKLVASMRS